MVDVLYLGDDLGAYSVEISFNTHNRHNTGEPWNLDSVPMVAEFARGRPEDLLKWLKGEVPEWPSHPSYSAIVVDSMWRDMIPVIKQVHPETPLVVSLAVDGEVIPGADMALGLENSCQICKNLESLLAAKSR